METHYRLTDRAWELLGPATSDSEEKQPTPEIAEQFRSQDDERQTSGSQAPTSPMLEGPPLYRELRRRYLDLTDSEDNTPAQAYDTLEQEYKPYGYSRATLQSYVNKGKKFLE